VSEETSERRWRRRGTMLLLLAFGAFLVYRYVLPERTARLTVSLTAGDPLGRRHHLAEALKLELNERKVDVKLLPTAGSEDAINAVAAGKIQLALVQGGLPEQKGVRQVSALVLEPLHLLVRPELLGPGLGQLRGKDLNLSTPGSGTRELAHELLTFAGMKAAIDYTELNHSYAELEAMPAAKLPDGIFLVSSLPSRVATFLIEERGYRLQPIPLGPALALRDAAVHDGVIPAYAYSVDPAVPPSELHTPATYLLLVAHEKVSEEAVTRFLEAIFQGEFARHAQLQRLSPTLLTHPPALPLHPGTREFLRRNDPLITAEAIDNLESLRSFFVSLAVAFFLLWRWQRQRSQRGFEEYIAEVSRLEAQALSIDSRYAIDLNAILAIRQRLSELKIEAMDKFAAGELRGEELMASFLTHVSDLRHYLNDMILHERTRLEKAARRSEDDADEVLERLWGRATKDREGDSVSH